MKKENKKMKRTVILMIAAFLLSGSVNSLHAQATASRNEYLLPPVRFTGANSDYLIFELNLTPFPPAAYTLRIFDARNSMVYEERLTEGTTVKRYKLERGDIQGLTFEIKSNDYTYRQSFDIAYKVEEKVTAIPRNN